MSGNFKKKIFDTIYETIRRTPFLNHLAHKVVQSEWIFEIFFYRRAYARLIKNKSEGIFFKPPVLEITITNKCNSRCIMCPGIVHGGEEMMTGELFKKIVLDAQKMNIKKMTLTGGEPLLVPDIGERIKFAKNHGFEYIHMFTNGSLLNAQAALGILQSGLDSLTISVDSPVKEKYEKIRVGLNFDVVFENIKNFNALKRQQQSSRRPLVRINMVTMKNNAQDRKLFRKMFGPYADIVEIIDSHNFAGGVNEYGENEYTQSVRFPCYLMFYKIIVDANGTVRKCSIDYSGSSHIGNLNNQTIEEILRSPGVIKLKNQMLNYDFSAPGCENCTFKESWWVNY